MSAALKSSPAKAVTVDTVALRSAVSALRHTLGRKHKKTVPILFGVLLVSDGSTLTLRTTDLDRSTTARIAANGDTVSAVIPHAAMTAALRAGNGETVSLRIDEDRGRVTMGLGTLTVGLRTMPSADFPAGKPFSPAHLFTVPIPAFRAALARVAHAMNVEETRYYLNGVSFRCGDDKITVAATDGHRLVQETIDCIVPSGIKDCIVPDSVVRSFLATKAPDTMTLAFNAEGTIGQMVSGNIVSQFKLIGGTFPDTQRVIPGKDRGDGTLSVDAAVISEAVRLLGALGAERGPPVQFDLGKPITMTVRGGLYDTDASQPLDAEWKSPPMEIGFQCRYITQMLHGVSGRVVFHILSGSEPVRISAEELPGWLAVLMPMRV